MELTPAIINELKSFLVERMVDNMETKDLEEYVTNDLDQYFENLPDEQFINEAQNYWDDGFDEVIEEELFGKHKYEPKQTSVMITYQP